MLVNTLASFREPFVSIKGETEAAYDGKEALEKVKQMKPDLILLDIMMPHLNGYQVCQKLKADHETKNIPVIMLSAKTQKVDQLSGKEAGANGYISKPFEFSELIDVINTSLNPQQKKVA